MHASEKWLIIQVIGLFEILGLPLGAAAVCLPDGFFHPVGEL
jgi:hypothetical protein